MLLEKGTGFCLGAMRVRGHGGEGVRERLCVGGVGVREQAFVWYLWLGVCNNWIPSHYSLFNY